MNASSRLLNRIVILIAGIAALVLGAAALAVAAVSDTSRAWTEEARTARGVLSGIAVATPLGSGGNHSWLWLVAVGICAAGSAMGILLIVRQGRGRTHPLPRRPAAPGRDPDTDSLRGAVVIEARVAEQAIVAALVQHPELLSVQVDTHLIRGARGLKVTAASRRGTSPTRTVELIERTVREWDTALGDDIPVLIELIAGIRTRTGHSTRVA